MSCCAVFCSSRTTKGGVKDPELSFHTFPKCIEVRNQWIKAVRRENWQPTKYSRLCSKHFDKSSFVTGLSIKKLKTDAVPIIFEGYPKYYQPLVKKRKQCENSNEDVVLTPRKRKRVDACGVKSEDLPTTPRRAMKVLISLSKARKMASRRLRLVKTLRESIRRIIKKNAKLLDVINGLKSRELVDTESLDVLASIGDKNKDLHVRFLKKHTKASLPKKYSPELRKGRTQ